MLVTTTKPIAKSKVDPRVCLALTSLFSVVVWQAYFYALLVYLLGLALIWKAFELKKQAPTKALGRMFVFCAFWFFMVVIFDLLQHFSIIWQKLSHGENPFVLEASQSAMLSQEVLLAGRKASLLFLRLLALLWATLVLTSLCSPRRLGLALTWFIRPLSPQNAWRPALAVALMAQYLPLILRMASNAKIGIASRGFKTTGLAYWLRFFSQLFKLLVQSTQYQAVAVVLRGLDTMQAWSQLPPLQKNNLLHFCGISLIILGVAFFLPK